MLINFYALKDHQRDTAALPLIGLALIFCPLIVNASTGTVSFSGSVSAPTCTVAATGAATGGGTGITLNFGDVPINQLQPGGTWASHGRDFQLVVTCPGVMTGYTRAKATFNALGGSGVDPQDTRLLRLTPESTARGVAIGLWKTGTGAPLDLNTSPSDTAVFDGGTPASATLRLSAIYSRTSALPAAGSANAILPFDLTYE